MQKPLDPMSVERTETSSVSYVLRRRYGPARHVIAVASWVMVINMLLQPIAVWAGTVTWDNGGGDNAWSTGNNWSGTPDNTEPTSSGDVVFPTPVAGSGTITLSAGEQAKSLTFRDSYILSGNDVTLAASATSSVPVGTVTITSLVKGTTAITKNAPGTLLFSGNGSDLNGALTVHGGELQIAGTAQLDSLTGVTLSTSGTLTVDNTVNNDGDRLPSNTITFSGGTLKFLGNASAESSETVGAMTLTGSSTTRYASTVDIQTGNNQNATVTFGSFARTAGSGSAVNVKYTNNGSGTAALKFTTAPTLSNSIVKGMFVNGADFATHTGNGTAITALAAGSYTEMATSGTDSNNSKVTSNKTLTGNLSTSSIKIIGCQTINLTNGSNNYTLTITSGPFIILKTGTGSATITGGVADALNGDGSISSDMIIRVDQGDLTISSSVKTRGSAPSSFAKSGPGLLILTPSTAWTTTSVRTLCVQEGAIRLDAGHATNFGNIAGGQALIRQLAGGVFELTADWSPTIGTASANVNWAAAADGGFAAYGATRTVTLNTTLTWNTANHVQNGKALLFNSDTANAKIVMANDIDLAGSALSFREFRVADNTGSTADYAEITGIISGSSHLLKTGTGRLDLSTATSTYTGETIVKEGSLNINGTLDSQTSAVTVMSGATLGGTGTINRPVTIADGGNMTLSVETPLKINGALTFNGSVDLALTGTVSDGNITLIENDGAETVTFSNYTEGQTVNYGGRNYVFTYVGDDGNDVMLRPLGGTVIMFR